MHYISGCSGAGKGYLMRETAWRTLGKCDNARIVYIPDFIGWTKCQNNNERLLYFYKAVMIGLADDEDFTFDKLGIDSEDSYTVDELMEMIIDGIAEYCKTIVIEGKPLRLLFCINNYKKTDDIIDLFSNPY
ncbi:hypothetical protein IWW48_002390 [Coemansia sp. RSA 1200]|nr:hypothetical protein IWW48_002390 [Coemansia sp. RSA 1200]